MDSNWAVLLRVLAAAAAQPGGEALRRHLAALLGDATVDTVGAPGAAEEDGPAEEDGAADGDGAGPPAGADPLTTALAARAAADPDLGRVLDEWAARLRDLSAGDPASAAALAARLAAGTPGEPSPEPPDEPSRYSGDHVDFGHGLFLGPVTGKTEQHIHLHAPAAAPNGRTPVRVPSRLPPDIADFTGRSEDLRTLDSLSRAADAPGTTPTVVISAIDGTPGVGKTTLAVHWAHTARERFPDGQVHLNLQGYAPTPAVKPRRALGELLALLGTPAGEIPGTLDARTRAYRDRLADRRVLIVLDNAENVAQVRPLLPLAPGCCVVVTSRSRMAGLAVRDGARLLTLDVLTPEESLAFFARVLTPERVAAEREAALAVAELCGRLPLALRIAAVRLAMRPSFGFADVRAELGPESERLEELSRGSDEYAAVMHVFSWSYDKLSPQQRRAFRRLGLHRGAVIGLSAAEAVLGVSRREARDLLDALTEAHLLEAEAPGRFRFHDLLRLYAQHRCREEESAPDAHRAVTRLLTWYVATAENADRALNGGREQVLAPVPVPEDVRPGEFGDADAALAWLDAEYGNILDAAAQASGAGLHVLCSRVPITLWSYFQRRSQWPEWLEVQRIGLAAARTAGDGPAEAWLLSGLGDVHDDLERYDEAIACHTEALEAHRALGDRRGRRRTSTTWASAWTTPSATRRPSSTTPSPSPSSPPSPIRAGRPWRSTTWAPRTWSWAIWTGPPTATAGRWRSGAGRATAASARR